MSKRSGTRRDTVLGNPNASNVVRIIVLNNAETHEESCHELIAVVSVHIQRIGKKYVGVLWYSYFTRNYSLLQNLFDP